MASQYSQNFHTRDPHILTVVARATKFGMVIYNDQSMNFRGRPAPRHHRTKIFEPPHSQAKNVEHNPKIGHNYLLGPGHERAWSTSSPPKGDSVPTTQNFHRRIIIHLYDRVLQYILG